MATDVEGKWKPSVGFPPKAYVIGAQKSGTTFLANLLAQHPGICVSEPKEAAFYTRHWERGLDWYRGLFADPHGSVLVDATPAYSAAPTSRAYGVSGPEGRLTGVPQRIRELVPGARFVYVVRDPVERTYSAYWHYVRAGSEHRPFREAIEADPHYLDTSRYWDQIGLYLEWFPQEAFLVLLFEELKADPVAVANRCFEFLGLANCEVTVPVSGRNRSYTYNGMARATDKLLRPVGGLERAVGLGRGMIPGPIQQGLGRLLTKRVPALEEADREYLRTYFAPHNRRLEEFLGRDLRGIWQC